MLTKQDLTQIKKIVRKEVHEEIQTELKPVKKDIQKIKKDVDLIAKSLDRDISTVQRKLDDHIKNHPYTVAT